MDMRELQEERAYWARLQRISVERDHMAVRSDIGIGACLASVEREIAQREAQCRAAGCEAHDARSEG